MWGIKDNPGIIGKNVENSNKMVDMCNELNIYNEDTGSESVDEPDDEETTQCQLALNIYIYLSPVSSYTSAAGCSSWGFVDSAYVFPQQVAFFSKM